MNTQEDKKQRLIERKNKLISLSQIVKKTLIATGDCKTVNEGLRLIYQREGHTNLKSFFDWKKEGRSIKKGEEALLLWATPKQFKKQAKEREQETEEQQGKGQYFPIAYLFSEKQTTSKDKD